MWKNAIELRRGWSREYCVRWKGWGRRIRRGWRRRRMRKYLRRRLTSWHTRERNQNGVWKWEEKRTSRSQDRKNENIEKLTHWLEGERKTQMRNWNESETETDRNKQKRNWKESETDNQTERDRLRQMETDRIRLRQTNKDRERKTDRQTDRQRGTGIERQRQNRWRFFGLKYLRLGGARGDAIFVPEVKMWKCKAKAKVIFTHFLLPMRKG